LKVRTRAIHGHSAPKCSKGLPAWNWKPFAFNLELVAGVRFELTTFGFMTGEIALHANTRHTTRANEINAEHRLLSVRFGCRCTPFTDNYTDTLATDEAA
jgi:hypothetical protein